MAVEEIYQFLKQHSGIFYSAKELKEILDLSQQTISRSLNILSRDSNIACENKKLETKEIYKDLNSRAGDIKLNNKKGIKSLTRRSWVYAYK